MAILWDLSVLIGRSAHLPGSGEYVGQWLGHAAQPGRQSGNLESKRRSVVQSQRLRCSGAVSVWQLGYRNSGRAQFPCRQSRIDEEVFVSRRKVLAVPLGGVQRIQSREPEGSKYDDRPGYNRANIRSRRRPADADCTQARVLKRYSG